MQNTLVFTVLGVSYLLLITSVTLIIFSKFKHTQFKQQLLHFLSVVLVIQLTLTTLNILGSIDGNLSSFVSNSYWVVLTLQVLCSLTCYMSVKRRKAKIRPSLDSFSMD
jgi:hypothetical protein